MKKNVKEIIMDILILIIVILLYVFVFMWIYTNFRERKRKEMSKGIIDVIDKEIKENKEDEVSDTEKNISYNKTNYTVLGKIRIKKINLYEPILKENTKLAYDTAVVKMYGPELNCKGNVVLGAHNFMRGKYFIKIKGLVNNDVITITDLTGRSINYYVYEYSVTTIDDATYLKAPVSNDEKIITLVTCTKGGKERYYVKAKAK